MLGHPTGTTALVGGGAVVARLLERPDYWVLRAPVPHWQGFLRVRSDRMF